MISNYIDTSGVRDLAPEVLDEAGKLRILPSSFWKSTTWQERALFGAKNGFYSYPTIELVEHLKKIIGERSALEIGAGQGGLAEALGIRACDNYMQDDPQIKALYTGIGQKTVPYGKNVEKLDAITGIKKYKPEVVISCWVTHIYDPKNHSAGGNMFGVDEELVLKNCSTYILVGNEAVHQNKKIWRYPHKRETLDFIFSRASNGSPDFIATWDRQKKT